MDDFFETLSDLIGGIIASAILGGGRAIGDGSALRPAAPASRSGFASGSGGGDGGGGGGGMVMSISCGGAGPIIGGPSASLPRTSIAAMAR